MQSISDSSASGPLPDRLLDIQLPCISDGEERGQQDEDQAADEGGERRSHYEDNGEAEQDLGHQDREDLGKQICHGDPYGGGDRSQY